MLFVTPWKYWDSFLNILSTHETNSLFHFTDSIQQSHHDRKRTLRRNNSTLCSVSLWESLLSVAFLHWNVLHLKKKTLNYVLVLSGEYSTGKTKAFKQIHEHELITNEGKQWLMVLVLNSKSNLKYFQGGAQFFLKKRTAYREAESSILGRATSSELGSSRIVFTRLFISLGNIPSVYYEAAFPTHFSEPGRWQVNLHGSSGPALPSCSPPAFPSHPSFAFTVNIQKPVHSGADGFHWTFGHAVILLGFFIFKCKVIHCLQPQSLFAKTSPVTDPPVEPKHPFPQQRDTSFAPPEL